MSSYFPVGIKFDDKDILLVGGGEIALFKFHKIMQFGARKVKCVANDFHKDILNNSYPNVEILKKEFSFEDLDGSQIVIVAIDDKKLQERIYDECQKKKLLCNCVDLLECCDFIFPSIVKRGDISIAITTNGLLPGFSAVLRKYVEDLLPEKMESGFDELVALRKTLPPGAKRMQTIREEAQKYLDGLRGKK